MAFVSTISGGKGSKVVIKAEVPPIVIAVVTKQIEIARFLLDNGANGNFIFVCDR